VLSSHRARLSPRHLAAATIGTTTPSTFARWLPSQWRIYYTAASSRSRHRHRPGSSHRDWHRCSVYHYVGNISTASGSGSGSTWLPRAAVVIAIGLARHVTIGIFARRTTTSQSSAARLGLYLRAAIVIAIGLALHAATGIVARRNATLRRNISSASRPASTVLHGCLELRSQSPSTWLFSPRLASLLGVTLRRSISNVSGAASTTTTWLFFSPRLASLLGVPLRRVVTSAARLGLYLRAAIVIGLALHAAIGIVARRNSHRPGSSGRGRHRCSA
jgi:hypothetical protein